MTKNLKSLFDSGRYEEIAIYQSDLSESQHLSISDLFYICAALYKLERFQCCINAILRAGINVSNSVQIANIVGSAYRRIGEPEKAIEVYDACMINFPNECSLYNNKANALIDSRQFNAALELINHALTLKPGYEDAIKNKSIVLASLEWEATRSDFVCGLESDIKRLDLLDPLLIAFDKQHPQYTHSDEIIDEPRGQALVTDDPNLREAFEKIVGDLKSSVSRERVVELLGLAREIANTDLQRALTLVGNAMQTDPAYPPCYQVHGECLMLAGNFQQALQQFLIASFLGQKNISLILNCATAFAQLGSPDLSRYCIILAKDLDESSEAITTVENQLSDFLARDNFTTVTSHKP